DRETADYIADGLREAGHTVDVARDGRDGLFHAAGGAYAVAVVDRMLPGLDGVGLVRTIRAAGVTLPVLFLSARGSVPDRVSGLEARGDDYLSKPFALSELLARVTALARRSQSFAQETVSRVADLEMDRLARRVQRAGRMIDLQPREFQILEYLLRHAGQLVTRSMLLEAVREFHFDPQTHVVDTHMSRLRSKIERGFDGPLIHTVRGAGYVIRAPD
ncbi:MAG: winged helix-turn-helix domain-containing protein, partial [Acetobacteraceae bacterium]